LLSANSVQFSGTAAEINALATNFALNPSANFNGEVNVQWSVTDVGASPLSASLASTLVITPVNDSPLWQGTLSLTVDQGRQFLFTRATFQASDIEDSSSQLVYEITGLPTHGQLLLNGQVLSNSSSFIQSDIDQGLVIYQHNNQGSVADNFSFKLIDSGGANSAVQTIQLNVQAAPVLIVTPPSGSGGGASTPPSGIGGSVTDPTGAGSTTTPPAAVGGAGTSTDIASANGPTAAANNTAVAPTNATQRSVPKTVVNANDSVTSSASVGASFESSIRASVTNREIAQPTQETVPSASSAASSQGNAVASAKFDGLGLMRIKTTAELAEYSDIARSTLRDKGFVEDVQKVRDEMNQSLRLDRNVVASTTVVSASLSIGYVIWLVRGGALLSSLMASLPAWRMVDPLPILANMSEGEDQSDDDSLDAMIDKHKAKRLASATPTTSSNPLSTLELSGL
jgi:Cadherin-like